MNRKSGFLRAIVLGGTIATGFALNSTDALAAEVDTEPVVSSVQSENQNEEVQEDSSIQKMEDAVEVIEGDAVAEEGYLENASEAIEKEKLTSEQADELTKNGKDVLEQAEEKNNSVKAELEKVTEETKVAKEAFKSTAEDVGLSEYFERAEEMSTNEGKIEIIEEAEAELKPTKEEVDKIINEIDSLEAQIKNLDEEIEKNEKIMQETVWVFDAQNRLDEVQNKYNEEEAKCDELRVKLQECQDELTKLQEIRDKCYEVYRSKNEQYEKIAKQVQEIEASIASCEEEIGKLKLEQIKLENALQDTSDEDEKQQILTELENVNDAIKAQEENRDMLNLGIREYIARQNEIEDARRNALNNLQAAEDDVYFAEDEIKGLNQQIDDSEQIQAEYKEALEFDYSSVEEQYYVANAQNLYAVEIRDSLVDDLGKYDVEYYRTKDAQLDAFFNAAENYKKSLRNEINANGLASRAQSAYDSVVSTYEKLISVIEDYKESQAQVPTEPEITEETSVESNTTTISKTVKDILTGITAVVEANITTKVTKVVKTIKDLATNVTQTVVTTKVDVAGSGSVKLYNRFGKLITTITGSVDLALNWLGGLFT